jgi:hypothetical protein
MTNNISDSGEKRYRTTVWGKSFSTKFFAIEAGLNTKERVVNVI